MKLPPGDERGKSTAFDLEQAFAHSVSQAEARRYLGELVGGEVKFTWYVLDVNVVKSIQYLKCLAQVWLN